MTNDNQTRKYYVKLDILHPHSTLRLFLFAEYGPLYNHHSFHQCLCSLCKEKCKEIRKENDIAKQLFLGKILIGSELNIEDQRLDWVCNECKEHCSTVHHLKSGPKNLHIVSDSELSKMESEINHKDILSCLVTKKEEFLNPITVEEEQILIKRQPMRVKYVPKLTKQQIIDILSELPTYKLTPTNIETEIENEDNKDNENEEKDENDEQNDNNPNPEASVVEQPIDNVKSDDPQTAENENTENTENADKDIEQKAETDNDKQMEEEEEGVDALSFYDISCVIRKVREHRKNDLYFRSITTEDPVTKAPKNRSKAIRTRALRHTSNKIKTRALRYTSSKNIISYKKKLISRGLRVPECEESVVLTALLHAYTHEIATLNTASSTEITQNVRLLRHLKKDNDTNWDSNCCLRNSNRLVKWKK